MILDSATGCKDHWQSTMALLAECCCLCLAFDRRHMLHGGSSLLHDVPVSPYMHASMSCHSITLDLKGHSAGV